MNYCTTIKEWRGRATPEQEKALLALLGGPGRRASFVQLAMNRDSKSARNPSALRAVAIERATKTLNASDPTVPLLTCGTLSAACRECPHWLASEDAKRVAIQ